MHKKYYSLKQILSKNAQYNIIFGERSNGKTYAVLMHGLTRYVKAGEQMAIVRRWTEDFTGKRGAAMFAALEENGEIKKLTGGEWTGVYYYASRWYLCRYDSTGKRESAEIPFAYGFSISAMEHDKSNSYPLICTILFDEFLSRQAYLPDEFILFMNVLSTIIRERKDVKIFMCGNTVNRYCPYFQEMGLKHIQKMDPGDIDVYTYGSSDLTVAVEYAKPSGQGKASDSYFAFDNPKLRMITGGTWEIDIYPHCPEKYRPVDVVFRFYIIFAGDTLECEIVSKNENAFIFIHRKTSEIHEGELIYTTDYDPRPNYRRKITIATSRCEEKIRDLFRKDKIFYADNETGEIVRNYLQWCTNK